MSYSDGRALYTDIRLEREEDVEHTVGLCIGKGTEGKGINCWSQTWSVDEQRYTNAQSYWLKTLVIDKARTSPDLTTADPLNCGSGDPMLGCWGVAEPRLMRSDTAYWFPAYRLLPAGTMGDTTVVIEGEEGEQDTIDSEATGEEFTGDVRWEYGQRVNLATFLKKGEDVMWTVRGDIELASALHGLVGGVVGAVLALAATML